MKKNAQFFSIDALIALTILIIAVITIAPVLEQSRQDSSIPSDILHSISSLKIGEMEGVDLVALNITDLNKSVIEQIGEFYLMDIGKAESLANQVLSSINPNENIGIWYGQTLLASKNITPFENAENVLIERQIISGIGGIAGVTGFSAKAFLSSNFRSDYFYFGGYVGEGNLSALINYQGNISSAKMELVINNDFDIYINGINSGSLSKSPDEYTPTSYEINTANFVSGENTIELKGNNLHISGGFIKINYDSDVSYEQPERHYFPGIAGIINLYDGFYIPGNITSLEISLHFNNTFNTFLSIGNVTVFNDSTNGEETITITNSTLSSLLDYSDLSETTIPFRFGIEDMSHTTNNSRDIDVFSVTSVSGQMQGGSKMDFLRAGNYRFVELMLNKSNNLVGLAAYEKISKDEDFHSLSDNATSLKNTIDGWKPGGPTCTCCGINRAVTDLLTNSEESKFRSIVIMSAGAANEMCAEQGTGNAELDAIKAACDAYANYDMRIYTIGFGESPNVQTLTDMAACGGGSFFSTVDDLELIYEQIAEELIETAYFEQTVEVSGNFFSRLYPDSYIEFDYTKETPPIGFMVTLEKKFSTVYGGSFEIPPTYDIINTRVISYSGPRWTSNAEINGNNIYHLEDYGSDYLELGDPYSISIPISLIEQNNIVNVSTGLSPANSTSGSINNSIIYIISKEMESYTSVSALAEGCNWAIQFENSNLTIPLPSDYSGTSICNYSLSGILCEGSPDCYDSIDAMQIAIYNLFKLLDFDSNGIIDLELNEQNLQINASTLTGIPFHHSTEVQVRKWY
jgi:hypothetical protein